MAMAPDGPAPITATRRTETSAMIVVTGGVQVIALGVLMLRSIFGYQSRMLDLCAARIGNFVYA
jgi:hypothetical protein